MTKDDIAEVFDRLSHHGVKEARLEFEIKGDHSIDVDAEFHLKDGGSIEMGEKDGVPVVRDGQHRARNSSEP